MARMEDLVVEIALVVPGGTLPVEICLNPVATALEVVALAAGALQQFAPKPPTHNGNGCWTGFVVICTCGKWKYCRDGGTLLLRSSGG